MAINMAFARLTGSEIPTQIQQGDATVMSRDMGER